MSNVDNDVREAVARWLLLDSWGDHPTWVELMARSDPWPSIANGERIHRDLLMRADRLLAVVGQASSTSDRELAAVMRKLLVETDTAVSAERHRPGGDIHLTINGVITIAVTEDELSAVDAVAYGSLTPVPVVGQASRADEALVERALPAMRAAMGETDGEYLNEPWDERAVRAVLAVVQPAQPDDDGLRERAARAVEALRPHIPPSQDPTRRTAIIQRSTLNTAARVIRAL